MRTLNNLKKKLIIIIIILFALIINIVGIFGEGDTSELLDLDKLEKDKLNEHISNQWGDLSTGSVTTINKEFEGLNGDATKIVNIWEKIDGVDEETDFSRSFNNKEKFFKIIKEDNAKILIKALKSKDPKAYTKLWRELKTKDEKKYLWELLESNTNREELLKEFDSNESPKNRYKELRDALDNPRNKEDSKKEIQKVFDLAKNNPERAQNILRSFTDNDNVFFSWENAELNYDNSNGNEITVKRDGKEYKFTPDKLTHNSLGDIYFKRDGIEYYSEDNKNMGLFLAGSNLEIDENGRWLVKGDSFKDKDGNPQEVVLDLGTKGVPGRRDIIKINENGKIEIWGEKGTSVKIGDKKFSPNTNKGGGRKLPDGRFYASVEIKDENVFEVEGNIITGEKGKVR